MDVPAGGFRLPPPWIQPARYYLASPFNGMPTLCRQQGFCLSDLLGVHVIIPRSLTVALADLVTQVWEGGQPREQIFCQSREALLMTLDGDLAVCADRSLAYSVK